MGLRFLRARREFERDEEGAVTIEALLWMPMFFYVLALSVDVSMIFHAYSRVIRVVEDVNRGLSIGRITTVSEGESKIASSLGDYTGVKSKITIVDNVIVSDVSVPVSSLVVLGAIKPMLGKSIEVKTQQYVEF
ncbi:pilus assembly protein [Frigidibacter sp. RF13]|uniref:TadE/TadG family type IV pilus assembly protein n=1 Tax=Frigidibacter sp. RF13 TaxID=2997340 RepID=UPI00226DAD6A|nr:TadE/TadG family type IV pilus assembly protein [Frigidibacter sp. RF13]MCY1127263.1 pilus assembly protein [Frigidibacter sp. RF13]